MYPPAVNTCLFLQISTSDWSTIRKFSRPGQRPKNERDPGARWALGCCDRSADFSALVIRSPKRNGRIRSAERTEVHLIATICFHELTFCP